MRECETQASWPLSPLLLTTISPFAATGRTPRGAPRAPRAQLDADALQVLVGGGGAQLLLRDPRGSEQEEGLLDQAGRDAHLGHEARQAGQAVGGGRLEWIECGDGAGGGGCAAVTVATMNCLTHKTNRAQPDHGITIPDASLSRNR